MYIPFNTGSLKYISSNILSKESMQKIEKVFFNELENTINKNLKLAEKALLDSMEVVIKK